MSTFFISDLHLSSDRQDITYAFFQFLDSLQQNCQALYILGDLFDYWVGDDDDATWHKPIKQKLKQVTESGIRVYFLAGNRDFAVGRRFSQQTGVTILPEVANVDLPSGKAVILHGDTLCTDDVSYQKYRRVIRNPMVMALLKLLPLSVRKKLAGNIRSASDDKKSQTAMEIMDVNELAVRSQFEQSHVSLMIHGHTHRPKIHYNQLKFSRATRIVLGDWYEQCSVLEVDEAGFHLHSLPFAK